MKKTHDSIDYLEFDSLSFVNNQKHIFCKFLRRICTESYLQRNKDYMPSFAFALKISTNVYVVIYFTIYFFRLASKLVRFNKNKDGDDRCFLSLEQFSAHVCL